MNPQAADLESLSMRVEVLERDFAALRDASVGKNGPAKSLARLRDVADEVEASSRRIFPAGVLLTQDFDFETGESFYVVKAKVSGTAQELVDHFERWHDMLWDVAQKDSIHFRLSMDPL